MCSETVPLWPDGVVPGETGNIGPEREMPPAPGASEVLRLTDVSCPTITIHEPASGTATGASVLVCPGGGYNILAFEHEGTMVCDWLRELGITPILLKYRVPRRDPDQPHLAPMQDVRQALALIRKNAAAWQLDPARIGMLGFSAGANLCIMSTLTGATPNPDGIAFMILAYPAYLLDESDTSRLRPDINVTPNAPSTFFVHADDDPHTAAGSALLYVALKQAGVSSELHIYASGAHGFGMLDRGHPVDSWHGRCTEWLRDQGWA